MGYHSYMRLPFLFRSLLLATLLIAGNLAYSNHATAHADNKVGHCEYCVCQAQTHAGPLPASLTFIASPQPSLLVEFSEVLFVKPATTSNYQTRAPPFIL
jgi:hypothetical protein